MKDNAHNYTWITDSKTLQVCDILNNLEQGLFTINLDGTINDEYSVITKKIMKIDDFTSSNIAEILRMDERQKKAFYAWLSLVKRMHSQIRWQKLSKLAPVQEIELKGDRCSIDKSSFISLSYHCIYDYDKRLSKIMILATDITEKRLKDQQIESERLRHQSDIKAIVTIANATVEEINEFMEDTTTRLGKLSSQVQLQMDNKIRQREEIPESKEYTINNEVIGSLYRDIHTIKSNSSSYGFDNLATIALQAEDQLEKLRQPVTSGCQKSLQNFKEYLVKMNLALDEIHQKIKLIYGESEEITMCIPEWNVNTIIEKCNALSNETLSTAAQDLIDECKKLSWKPLGVLLRKYQKSALRAARKLHKNVDIVVKNEKQFFNPLIITRLDEIILQLVQNAVDHGIESLEIRDDLGKSTGKIYIEIDIIDEFCFLVVSDDGRGIDVEAILTNAVNKKVITPEEAVGMSNDEKIALLFRSGLSTSKVVNEISGRGMGMDIVKHRIETLGGTITTNSLFGQGTTFCLKIPVHSLT
jgi:chemotaxis protein histidine kinase CheA